MKMKKYIALLTMLVMVGLTSCFEEYDEGYDLIGRVATVPVFTISSSSAAPGATVTANFRYYSEHEPVTALRLIETINGEERVANSKEVTGHNLADSYEDSLTYEVPQVEAGTSIRLQVEVETANGLSNRNIPTLNRTITVTAPAE
jgi:phosphoribulokinase